MTIRNFHVNSNLGWVAILDGYSQWPSTLAEMISCSWPVCFLLLLLIRLSSLKTYFSFIFISSLDSISCCFIWPSLIHLLPVLLWSICCTFFCQFLLLLLILFVIHLFILLAWSPATIACFSQLAHYFPLLIICLSNLSLSVLQPWTLSALSYFCHHSCSSLCLWTPSYLCHEFSSFPHFLLLSAKSFPLCLFSVSFHSVLFPHYRSNCSHFPLSILILCCYFSFHYSLFFLVDCLLIPLHIADYLLFLLPFISIFFHAFICSSSPVFIYSSMYILHFCNPLG